jgi:phasin family protein
MAEDADKQSDSAEKAYAAAAAAAPAKVESAKPVAAPKVAKPTTKAVPKVTKPVPAPKKPKKPLKTLPPAPVAVAVKAIEPAKPKPTITELKEKIMASAKTPDFSKTITDTVSELQAKAKAAYDKGTEFTAEATEFAKGNVEALVESGKIFAAGVQDLGKTYADEAKSAYETATADLKEMAAVKSPTDLFQLQGKLLRRNFDTFVAYTTKNTEAVTKLANDSFAPLSGRVSLAAEKIAKVA